MKHSLSPRSQKLAAAFVALSFVFFGTVVSTRTDLPVEVAAAITGTTTKTLKTGTTKATTKVTVPKTAPRMKTESTSSRSRQVFYGGGRTMRTFCGCSCENSVSGQVCAEPLNTFGGMTEGQCDVSNYHVEAEANTDCEALNGNVSCTGYLDTGIYTLPGTLQNCYKFVDVSNY